MTPRATQHIASVAEPSEQFRYFVDKHVRHIEPSMGAHFESPWNAHVNLDFPRRGLALQYLGADVAARPGQPSPSEISAQLVALVGRLAHHPPTDMEARVRALEKELAALRTELATVKQQVSDAIRADEDFEAELTALEALGAATGLSDEADDFDYSFINRELGLERD